MTLIRSILGISNQQTSTSAAAGNRKYQRNDKYAPVVIESETYLEKLTQYAIGSLEYRLQSAYPVYIQLRTAVGNEGERTIFEIIIPHDKPVRRALDLTTYVHQADGEENSRRSTFYLFQCTVGYQQLEATSEVSVHVEATLCGPVLKIEFAKGQIVYGNPEISALTFISPFNPIVSTVSAHELINVINSVEATTYITLHQ